MLCKKKAFRKTVALAQIEEEILFVPPFWREKRLQRIAGNSFKK
jgi:hypothetical protein